MGRIDHEVVPLRERPEDVDLLLSDPAQVELLAIQLEAVVLESRGLQLETYLSMTGQSPDQLVERLRDEATRSVARELVLEAAAEQLGIEVSDEEIETLVREQAEAFGDDPDESLQKLRESGRMESLRDDLRLRHALDRIASEVKRIPRELAEVRESLWTPDKEKPQTEAKLWTPGS